MDTASLTKQPTMVNSQQPPQQGGKVNSEPSSLTNNKPGGHIEEAPSQETAKLLAQLEDELKIHIRAQKFVEAETTKNRIKEIKLEILMNKSRGMELRHLQEAQQLAESQALEIDGFNREWDLSVNKFKQEARNAEDEMMKKHEADLIALEQDLQASIPMLIRTSPRIVNMKKMIETLAKQNDFVQANTIKAQCSVLEQEELRKSEEQKDKKILYILNQLANKQTNELNGLRKRVATSYAELLKARATEYQKLNYKLHNVKKSIENAQQIEISKFELAYKNYVPGETIRFKARKRENSAAIRTRNINESNISMNTSFNEGAKSAGIPGGNRAKRSVTPSRNNNFHIKGHIPSTLNKTNVLIPIRPGRSATNQRANQSVLDAEINKA